MPVSTLRGHTRKSVSFLVTSLLLVISLTVLVMVPVPYVITRPGPTVDTLSENGDVPIINVSGAPTYETGDGSLRLTTVSLTGGPNSSVPLVEAIGAWLRRDSAVEPTSVVFPETVTSDELATYNATLMTQSQTNASAAALSTLGYDVTMVTTVAAFFDGVPAASALQVGDVLRAMTINGQRTELTHFGQLTSAVAAVPAGTEVTMEVARDGVVETVTFETVARPEGDTTPGSMLGVYIINEVDPLPVDIEFDIDSIGGPSAGLMFSLGIIDLLTPGEMTGGEPIAGTGTMSVDGQIGPIGGIQQKLYGAQRDGAAYFLVPAGNCEETIGNTPDGLQLVRVSTLAEAIDAVTAIGEGNAQSLPSCAAP